MTAKQIVFGPYRVKNLGIGGDQYQIVELEDVDSRKFHELHPLGKYKYKNKRSARNQCYRMNKRWMEENALDDEALENWRRALELSEREINGQNGKNLSL